MMAGTAAGLVLPFRDIFPRIAASALVAPGAAVIGDVDIGPETGVWFNCVIRGDVNSIHIGAGTNVQDGTVVHVTPATHATHIGDNVTIGHRAVIHGCTLEDASFVGMAATVMDGAVVESGAMVAAGALVTPGRRVPSGELWAGMPAKYVRDVSEEERTYNEKAVRRYASLARLYIDSLERIRSDT
jgi:carbonic anhydrase/acetyltransferase-like protein (isoleucine patch superfamily)